jgi:hypothetical protein
MAMAPGLATGTVSLGPPPTILHGTILVPGHAGTDPVSISTRVEGAAAARLGVRLSLPGDPEGFGPCVHEESVGDRVLTFFRFKVTERRGRVLELAVTGAKGDSPDRVRIPLDSWSGGGALPASIVVPEVVLTETGVVSWTPLEFQVLEASLLALEVVASDGTVVVGWEPIYLEPGPILVFWDGRTASGSTARSGLRPPGLPRIALTDPATSGAVWSPLLFFPSHRSPSSIPGGPGRAGPTCQLT